MDGQLRSGDRIVDFNGWLVDRCNHLELDGILLQYKYTTLEIGVLSSACSSRLSTFSLHDNDFSEQSVSLRSANIGNNDTERTEPLPFSLNCVLSGQDWEKSVGFLTGNDINHTSIKGVFVSKIYTDTNLYACGLRAGHQILAVGSKQVDTATSSEVFLQTYFPHNCLLTIYYFLGETMDT